MNRAKDLWAKYRKMVYHTDALSPIQERECSMAFYAGMEASFRTLSEIAAESEHNDESEKEAADRCEVFRVEVKRAAMEANLDRSDGRS